MAYYNSKKILGVVANNANVNTGDFDPTSDNPAGQKSMADEMGKEIVRTMYLNVYNKVREEIRLGIPENEAIFEFRPFSSDIPECASSKFSNFPIIAEWSITRFKIDFIQAFVRARITEFDYCNPLQKMMNNGAFDALQWFFLSNKLVTIGAYDMTNCSNLEQAFYQCYSLKHLHLKNIPVSFNISDSTEFEKADLVEILNNLVDLTGKTSQTLTMGATNFAKLTDTEKAIATNKNWVLA